MTYGDQITNDMQQLVNDNSHCLDSTATIEKFIVLAGYYNDWLQYPLFSLRKEDIKKTIKFYEHRTHEKAKR